MNIALPKEIKDMERRVALTPRHVHDLVVNGHKVYVGTGAGKDCGFSDKDWEFVGAHVTTNEEAYNNADLVVKVKEPLAGEVHQMKAGATVFSYLHLAAALETKLAMKNRGVRGIPFEAVSVDGAFPLLKPMSEIAGRLAAIEAEQILLKNKGSTLDNANVLVYGGGVAGTAAALACEDRGACVSVIDKSPDVVERFNKNAYIEAFEPPPPADLRKILEITDVVIGAVLIPGKKAPKVLNEMDMIAMEDGGVFVDIAIDQGGCSTTSAPTTHSNPTYDLHHITHYCVTNIPGKAYLDATDALSDAIEPYVKILSRDVYGLDHFREV